MLMANQGVGLNHNHEYVIFPSVLDIDEREQYPKQLTVLGTTANMIVCTFSNHIELEKECVSLR